MLFYMLILFGLYGWIEFEALILIGNEIGGLASFLGIFVTAFIGMWLLRAQGRAVMMRWQSNLNRGEIETDSLASGLSLLLGGFLMLLPGYVTDAIGILCFVPGVRFIIGNALLSRLHIAKVQNMFGARFAGGFAGTPEEGFGTPEEGFGQTSSRPYRRKTLDGDVIEGDFKEKD
jgi:UPF0716 protein FxsA